MVSHELRTPLTAIKEGIGIVYDGVAGTLNDEQKDFLGLAKRNVDRLARLINDVLDFQKLEAGRMEFRFAVNDKNDVVRDIERTMRLLAEGKGLELIIKLDKDIPKAKFDRDKIVQVLTNLVNNAIKFTDKGRIEISTAKLDSLIYVSVADTGPGVRPEDMKRLFHSFEQFGKARKKVGEQD